MLKVGFDMDGVIIDNTVFKSDLYRQKTGIKLECWKFNSNVIDDYITNTPLRKEIDKISAISVHHKTTEQNMRNILLEIKSHADIFLISSRGKSEEGVLAARQTIKNLKLDTIFGDNIFFTKNDGDKIEKIKFLEIDFFIEDRFDVISMLPKKTAILYDQFFQWKKYKKYIIIKSLLDIIPLIRFQEYSDN